MKQISIKTSTLAANAILGALVVVFDYTMKFSGFKIPFPWLTTLKFDFTGIPIVLAFLIYGFSSGSTTSIIAFLAILLRSGNFVSASMRGLTEFSQILGMTIGLKLTGRLGKVMSFVFGIVFRCIIMSVANIIIFPLIYGMPVESVTSLLPLIAVFNAAMGVLSMFVGVLLYKTLLRRVPSLFKPQ